MASFQKLLAKWFINCVLRYSWCYCKLEDKITSILGQYNESLRTSVNGFGDRAVMLIFAAMIKIQNAIQESITCSESTEKHTW